MKKKPGKIVAFPGTVVRLQQQAEEALGHKQFDEAARLFEAAVQFEPENEDVKMGLLASLYESGRYEDGIALSSQMLNAGEGPYFDVVELHILMLIQQKRYQEVADTLAALLEEGLPPDRYEQFAHLKQMADRMTARKPASLFEDNDTVQDKMMKVVSLAGTEADPFEADLIRLLESNREHPFLQTMALGVLRENGTAKPVTVRKFDEQQTIVPAMALDVFDGDHLKEAAAAIEEAAAQNPAVLEQSLELAKQYAYVLYPFDPPFPAREWGKAVAAKTASLYAPSEAAGHYADAWQLMEKLDEISPL